MNTEEMLKILVCPKCGGALTALPGAEKPEGFFCGHCGVVYPCLLYTSPSPRDCS